MRNALTLQAAIAAPDQALRDFVAQGYEPSGDGGPGDRIEHVRKQAVIRVLINVNDDLRRSALNADSGYISALINGIVNAPHQDLSLGAQIQACCGTIKPHVRPLASTIELIRRRTMPCSRSSKCWRISSRIRRAS